MSIKLHDDECPVKSFTGNANSVNSNIDLNANSVNSNIDLNEIIVYE